MHTSALNHRSHQESSSRLSTECYLHTAPMQQPRPLTQAGREWYLVFGKTSDDCQEYKGKRKVGNISSFKLNSRCDNFSRVIISSCNGPCDRQYGITNRPLSSSLTFAPPPWNFCARVGGKIVTLDDSVTSFALFPGPLQLLQGLAR